MRKFGRFKNSARPRRLLLGIHPVPTMVTLGNLLCGFAAIVLAMRADNPPREFYNFTANECLYWAGIMIFAAMVFDVMDGKVARWTKSSSKFGMEMDSLCDVVSFGVAPAVLVKAMIDQHLPQQSFPMLDRYIWPMLAVYVCCAALRLARYNVEADTGHRDFFFGLPSPGAAGCVASLAVLIVPGRHQLPMLQNQLTVVDEFRQTLYWPVLTALPFIMLVLGVLMVTRVHYPHIGDRLLRGRKSFMHVMLLGLAMVLIVTQHEIMLALAFNGYMLLGVFNEVRYQFFPSQRPEGWVVSAEPPEPAAPSPKPHAGLPSTGESSEPPALTKDPQAP